MGKQGSGNVTQSEESITLMTPYGVLSIYLLTVADPSRSFRMTFNVPLIMAVDPLLMFRMTPNGNHMLRLLTHS